MRIGRIASGRDVWAWRCRFPGWLRSVGTVRLCRRVLSPSGLGRYELDSGASGADFGMRSSRRGAPEGMRDRFRIPIPSGSRNLARSAMPRVPEIRKVLPTTAFRPIPQTIQKTTNRRAAADTVAACATRNNTKPTQRPRDRNRNELPDYPEQTEWLKRQRSSDRHEPTKPPQHPRD